MDSERYQREAKFHDTVFTDDTRQSTGKFYAVTGSSKAFYRTYIVEHSKQRRVLEYGCGPYSHSPLLARQGGNVFGIDISQGAIRQYRDWVRGKEVPTVHSLVMNAEQLGFSDSSFDLICGTGILHHLDLSRSYREVARTLSPGGSAVFIEPLGHNPLINLYRRLTPTMRTEDEHPLMMQDLEMAKQYFQSVEVSYYHLSSLASVPFHSFSWFKGMVTTLDRLDSFLFKTAPFLRKHAWAAVLLLRQPRKN